MSMSFNLLKIDGMYSEKGKILIIKNEFKLSLHKELNKNI